MESDTSLSTLRAVPAEAAIAETGAAGASPGAVVRRHSPSPPLPRLPLASPSPLSLSPTPCASPGAVVRDVSDPYLIQSLSDPIPI